MPTQTSFLDINPNKMGEPDTVKYATEFDKGLSAEVVKRISEIKSEPAWMLNNRLKAFEHFLKRPMPTWGPNLSAVNFSEIVYFRSSGKNSKDWKDVPEQIKNTFERLGIPEAERKFLAGAGAQFESESIYHKIRDDLAKLGVIFCDMDTALKLYPDIVKKYFGTVVPYNDNKFAALNTAVWSGGSFVYVPKGVHVDLPLQAYFRINAERTGQFERTMIIVEEGASVHYIEGCFTKGAVVHTNPDFKPIEEIKVGDRVLTHTGEYKNVYHTQIRPYTGDIFKIAAFGNPNELIEVTGEHPFLCVKRKLPNEKNKLWKAKWTEAKELKKGDYLAIPRNKVLKPQEFVDVEIEDRRRGKAPKVSVRVPSTKEFFRLAGYYLAEGSISNGFYLNFSFGSHEKELIEDTKLLLKEVFGVEKTYEAKHKANHGISVVVASVKLARVFESLFSKGNSNKKIPYWMVLEEPEKQKELIVGFFRGDGNYYGKNTKARGWLKEVFRINTTSEKLAKQTRDILIRLGIASFINKSKRSGNRKPIYTIGVTGEFMKEFGKIVGREIEDKLNGKKRATMFHVDENYMYMPIRKIEKIFVENISVYNFSVEGDESYVAQGVAVHNCSAPSYSENSLHAAVVEVIALPGSRVRYTTLQNWATNVFNLVTKRAHAHAGAYVEWVDANVGSAITMKYPSVFLIGEGARADILSVAFANSNQIQDTGAKAIHAAPNTSSTILSKSVSKGSGFTNFRGLVEIYKGARNSKSHMKCDALMLDPASRSDTIPTLKIDEREVQCGHEAVVGKVSEDQLFYLMSRGLTEDQATTMIVSGFLQAFTKSLPLEYAIEFNRLIELEMTGAVG